MSMYRDRFDPFRPDGQPWLRFLGLAALAALVLAAVYVIWNGFYTVAAHEQAVVLRFGEYRTTEGPGLHFMIPLVDEPIRVNTAEQTMRLPTSGELMAAPGGERPEALILTGDLYAGVVEWNVNWRVAEPEKFIFSIATEHVDRIIAATARSVMHRAVGDYSADEILTGKREEIGLGAHREMQALLDAYDCGIHIVALQMQRVTPPETVKPAFDDVNASIQQRDKLVNEAKRERNRMIPQAEATRDKLIRSAEGYAARRRAEAEGEISALMARYRAYREAPEATRRRLYLENMEKVLTTSGPKTILDSDLRGLVPLLNLQETEKR